MAQSKFSDQVIELNKNDISLQQLITTIESQTELRFSFNPNALPLESELVFTETKITVRQALNAISKTLDLSYVLKENIILLKKINVDDNQVSVYGYIRDEQTGENLISATLVEKGTARGTTSNFYGYYSMQISAGQSTSILCSYVGYQPTLINLTTNKDTLLNIRLVPQVLDEIVVVGSELETIHEKVQMSAVDVPVDQIKKLPAFLGEVDVLKVLQLLPGVKSSEGSTGLYVRGGGPDQNLILLDGVPVYNASHLFGFFSLFNADAINHVELIKGGFPARYGGRLSSVIDIAMKDGNMKEIKGEASIGIISAKATVEGPIKKDKTSFIFSARRTYLDVLAKPIVKQASGDISGGYFFYDINAKVNHIINKKNRIYLSHYMGDDVARGTTQGNEEFGGFKTATEDKFNLYWGNIITAARWNRVITPKLFANVTGTLSRYRFVVANKHTEQTRPEPEDYTGDILFDTKYLSGIRDVGGKMDFEWIPNTRHYVRFGVQLTAHHFSPGVYAITSNTDLANPPEKIKPIDATEGAIYAEDDWTVGDRLKINAGLHASNFSVEETSYQSLQPRISARYLLGNDIAAKASYTTMTQFIHFLTNAGIGLPTDMWLPSTRRVAPQQSWQGAFGLSKTYRSAYEISLDGYFKEMTNLIEYKDGATYTDLNSNWQDKIVMNGLGRSYGAELFVQKKEGDFTGWVGYTLSWANRQFEDINQGRWFPYRYDRRHDISIAMTHEWNKKMDFSVAWVYGTGNNVTLATSTYKSLATGDQLNYSNPILFYSGRNNFRMKAYHRLDVSFSFWKQKKRIERKWIIAVYNLYSRKNPYFITTNKNFNGKNSFSQFTLFPIIPSIAYSFKF
ncbi:MAG: TonB-dependent receptor [Cytophagia bacterium]|nr:TonB-dependent receptor [Cytophagia bacterium]